MLDLLGFVSRVVITAAVNFGGKLLTGNGKWVVQWQLTLTFIYFCEVSCFFQSFPSMYAWVDFIFSFKTESQIALIIDPMYFITRFDFLILVGVEVSGTVVMLVSYHVGSGKAYTWLMLFLYHSNKKII